MKFQIGKAVVFANRNQETLIVLPIAGLMVAVKIELFNVGGSSSVNIQSDIYEPEDLLVVGKVQRWIKEIEEESANS